MSSGKQIDQARLARLEQALNDVRTHLRVWRKCAANESLSNADNAEFSAAYDRLQELSGVLTEDVGEMTGQWAFDVGGKYISLFAGAVEPNAFDGTVFGAPGRIHSLRQLESVLRNAIGLVKNGFKPIRERRRSEPTVSIFEQARDELLKALLTRRSQPGYSGPEVLATMLGRSVDDVVDDLYLLRDQGLVSLVTVDQGHGIITANLEPRGVQRAREGYEAARVAPSGGTSIRFGDNTTIGALGVAGHDVTQHVRQTVDRSDLRRALGELIEAIQSLDRSVADRAIALTVAKEVAAAVESPEPSAEQLADHWTWLGRFADGLAVAGVVTSIPSLYHQAAPLIAPLLRLAGG